MENFKIKVDDSFEYDLKNIDTNQLDLLKLSKNHFHVIHNHKSFDIKLEKSDFNNKKYVITVNANT